MSINTVQVAARTHPWDGRTAANGSYTLPQYAFIPHPDLQQLSSGFVSGPLPYGFSAADFAAIPGISSRPYPTPDIPVYGIRVINQKVSP